LNVGLAMQIDMQLMENYIQLKNVIVHQDDIDMKIEVIELLLVMNMNYQYLILLELSEEIVLHSQ
jgi:hypothetical protein